jgi:hypothetical protein
LTQAYSSTKSGFRQNLDRLGKKLAQLFGNCKQLFVFCSYTINNLEDNEKLNSAPNRPNNVSAARTLPDFFQPCHKQPTFAFVRFILPKMLILTTWASHRPA